MKSEGADSAAPAMKSPDIMASEVDDFIPLSSLQHVVFCERQAALIHVERAWDDNFLTAHGQAVHERTNEAGHDIRRGVRVDRAVPLRSTRLRIQGVADCVEWQATPAGPRPRPVETKRGRFVKRLADEVQVCAQAICLEERLGVVIDVGVLFYAASRRRVDVPMTPALRAVTEGAARRVQVLLAGGRLPVPQPGPKCRSCSLVELCQPEQFRADQSRMYLGQVFQRG